MYTNKNMRKKYEDSQIIKVERVMFFVAKVIFPSPRTFSYEITHLYYN